MIEWQFEHFKTFTPYQIMQQAAAALAQFEGENTDGKNPKMRHLTEELILNTGHPAWMPDRDSENLDINVEGSVFRNKARLFSSFLICVPPDLLNTEEYEKSIMLTDFGRALASGKISEEEFYRYIIKKFQYPHLAFSDYQKWVDANITLRPLLCIIKTLVGLFERAGKVACFITAKEIYKHLQTLEDENCDIAVNGILLDRKNSVELPYTTEQIRKISEMLAFLSIAGYIYIDSSESSQDKYWLNLVMRHPKEKTMFYLERSAGGAGTGTKKTKVNVIKDVYKTLWED